MSSDEILNTNLIRQLVAEGNSDRLITLFEFLTSGRNRAEFEVATLRHKVDLLTKSLNTIKAPRISADMSAFAMSKPDMSKPTMPKPELKTKSKPARIATKSVELDDY